LNAIRADFLKQFSETSGVFKKRNIKSAAHTGLGIERNDWLLWCVTASQHRASSGELNVTKVAQALAICAG
jgi:hypothetical protein